MHTPMDNCHFPNFLGLLCRIAGLLLLCQPVFSQTAPEQDSRLFFSNTAYTQPARQGGFALLHTSRYGLSKRLELGFHPILIFLSPDLELKWKQIENSRYTLSSFHAINYPSPLLRTLQISGAGGFVSPEFSIPDMFAFQNGLLWSSTFSQQHTITGKLLFEFSVHTAGLDERTTIDLPLVFPRSAVYYKSYGFITSASIEGKLIGRFSYFATTDAYFFPRDGLDFFNETTMCLVWQTGKKFLLLAGGELTYGDYPFGKQWHLLPVVDFRWFLRI